MCIALATRATQRKPAPQLALYLPCFMRLFSLSSCFSLCRSSWVSLGLSGVLGARDCVPPAVAGAAVMGCDRLPEPAGSRRVAENE